MITTQFAAVVSMLLALSQIFLHWRYWKLTKAHQVLGVVALSSLVALTLTSTQETGNVGSPVEYPTVRHDRVEPLVEKTNHVVLDRAPTTTQDSCSP